MERRRRRRIATLCIIHTFACSMHVPRASVSTNLSPVEIALSLGAASFPPFPIQANFRFTYLARISKKKKRKRSKKEKRRGFNLRSTIGYLLLSARSSVKCKSPLVRGWPREFAYGGKLWLETLHFCHADFVGYLLIYICIYTECIC